MAAEEFDPPLVPELLVSNVSQSIEFWCGLCGFEIAHERPDEGFAYITLGSAHIMLEQQVVGRNWTTGPIERPFGRGINFQIGVPQYGAHRENSRPSFLPHCLCHPKQSGIASVTSRKPECASPSSPTQTGTSFGSRSHWGGGLLLSGRATVCETCRMTGFHHIEFWINNIEDAGDEWGWLLNRLGFTLASSWEEGQSWASGGAYLTLTTSPNTTATTHDRRRPGVNHLAFKAGSPTSVDSIMTDAPVHGWRPLYHDRYPHAGGQDHYAGWLENTAGFKAEVVADQFSPNRGNVS